MPQDPAWLIKREAARLGFDYCGISPAGFLEEEAARLERWLGQGMHGRMAYMANHFDKRLDPRQLVPGARSVVSLMMNYTPPALQKRPDAPKISRYAYGRDYHGVIRDKLHVLMHFIRSEIGAVQGRVFVDSAPVLERAWAAKSGLGWRGKNTNLIHPRAGSYFFLAEAILDLELAADGPMRDYCGTCTACIDACPTDAIRPYEVDGSKCISYFTIELKDALPENQRGHFENWAFGCDICQEVCPWNRFSKPHAQRDLAPYGEVLDMTKKEWVEMTEEVFETIFRDSPLQRTGYQNMKRNLDFLYGPAGKTPRPPDR
jgi:epoxyqueuosine reductase